MGHHCGIINLTWDLFKNPPIYGAVIFWVVLRYFIGNFFLALFEGLDLLFRIIRDSRNENMVKGKLAYFPGSLAIKKRFQIV